MADIPGEISRSWYLVIAIASYCFCKMTIQKVLRRLTNNSLGIARMAMKMIVIVMFYGLLLCLMVKHHCIL